jgi:hypothetical protein
LFAFGGFGLFLIFVVVAEHAVLRRARWGLSSVSSSYRNGRRECGQSQQSRMKLIAIYREIYASSCHRGPPLLCRRACLKLLQDLPGLPPLEEFL